ncbi:hypothetical protein [Lysinibacillus xylanilyticus]|uniref:hypothetical protein n=1 Tax=Lysinibacillus xylanilyticus TaxID=582475 RepID=UPI00381F4803
MFFAQKRSANKAATARFNKVLSNFCVLSNTFTFYHPTFDFYRLTFTFYRPTFDFYRPTFKFYRLPPAKEQKKIHTQNCACIFMSPSLHSNQLIHITYVLTKCYSTFVFYRNTFTFYRQTFEFYRLTFMFYHPTFEFYRLTFTFYRPTFKFYRHPPAEEQKKIHTQNCA